MMSWRSTKCFVFLCVLYTSNGFFYSDNSLSNAVSQLNQTVQQQGLEIIQLKQEVQHLRNAVETSPVVFCAELTQDLFLRTANQTIIFDKVITNVGNAYNRFHGYFTAPVAGYYHLSTTVMSVPQQWLDLEIASNGIRIIDLHGSSLEYDTGAASLDIALGAGDMVWVRSRTSNRQTVNGRYSLFSGFLISEI